jgi:hypothetical protein
MKDPWKPILVALVAAASCSLILVTLKVARADDSPQNPAELWLSWSPQARETYVWGYMDGFNRGGHTACYFHAEKITPYLPQKSVPVEELPEVVCNKALPQFTESTHFDVYVEEITQYYKKYPRDRQAGAGRLLEEMASPPGLTVDQIHEKLTR